MNDRKLLLAMFKAAGLKAWADSRCYNDDGMPYVLFLELNGVGSTIHFKFSGRGRLKDVVVHTQVRQWAQRLEG